MMQRVVVGVDGSPAAAAALTWAAEEARLRGAELVAWTVLGRPPGTPAAGTAAPPPAPFVSEESTNGYPVTVRHGYGEAAAELIHACSSADLLVVGARGRSHLAGLLLGSVSRTCLQHAPCPVVVVRGQPLENPLHRRVVVGIDMSGHSRLALLAGTEEARLRGAALEVVHAAHWDRVGTELITPTPDQLVEWARKLVADELAAAGVTARPVVTLGAAADVLVRYSADADLLVLGSRGRGPVAGRLLGSTSEYCAHHAQCPVMLVRPARDRTDRRSTAGT